MSYERARHNMIEQQLRPWRIGDPDVIDQLAVGGRLAAFVCLPAQAPTMTLRCLTRVSPEAVASEDILETSVPMLKQAAVKQFVF